MAKRAKPAITAKGKGYKQGASVRMPINTWQVKTLEEIEKAAAVPPTLEDFCAQTLDRLHTTLVQRGASYGSFFENSEIAVSIQELLQTTSRDHVTAMQERAMAQTGSSSVPISLVYLLLNASNMIAAKQSRLFATPVHADSWLDIAGYAILAHAAIKMKLPE